MELCTLLSNPFANFMLPWRRFNFRNSRQRYYSSDPSSLPLCPRNYTNRTNCTNHTLQSYCTVILLLMQILCIHCCYVYPPDVEDPCKNKECSFGARCVPSIDGRSARCECPDRCDRYGDSTGSKPVCGSDSKDYVNECEMQRAACRDMKDVSIRYHGKCDPCDGYECPVSEICQLGPNRTPICKCNSLCALEFSPVCGSDGRTYSNECIMEVEGCKSRKEIWVLYHGECSSRDNPCNALTCGPGEECQVDRSGVARCECPPGCEEVLRPVCGDDRNTYDNECEMRRQSCLAKKIVAVMFYGECAQNGPCSTHRCDHESMCVVQNNRPVCECPTCSEQFKPVCGSDGISYGNECKLKAEACEQRKTIVMRYRGLCDGCEREHCDHYALCESDGNGGSTCICPERCVQVEDPVCGTDGVTYVNECELRVASCRRKKFISIALAGPCDRCLNVNCRYGARCENGRCMCPQSCSSIMDPVCADDGETYQNECEMRQKACDTNQDLEIVHNGECEELSGSGDGSGMDICDEETCRYGGTCEYDAEGLHGCVCNFNCPAIRSPICGSDGKTHGNDCQRREESCRRQIDIYALPMQNCEDLDEELCDGAAPLLNPMTGADYDCGVGHDACPAGTFCHRRANVAKCCQQEQPVKSCRDTRHGCCPDGRTAAPGPNNAGCPSICLCHPLGAYSQTCDPTSLQCTCKPGVGGRRCDRCEPGFWGLPRIAHGNSGCTPCGCNIFGSVRDDCEQMTGRCICKQGVTGQKCTVCPDGKDLGSQGCSDSAMPISSCDFLHCRYGAHCEVNKGVAECQCDMTCPSDVRERPVCGTDGNMYGSECQLRLLSCRLQQNVQKAYDGRCQDSTTSSPYSRRKTTRHVDGKHTAPGVLPTPNTPEYGFIGEFCLEDIDCKVDHSHCKSNLCTCQHGYAPSPDDIFCLETAYMVPSFSGTSYLEFNKIHHTNRELLIELEFKALNKDGILLFSSQTSEGLGDFLSLAINDGHVQLRYDLGSGALLLETPEEVKLNTFHKVTARRFGQDGTLRLDEGVEVSGSSPGSLKSLNLNSPLYIGYIPADLHGVLIKLGVSLGMVGCIESMKVESTDISKDYNLMYPGSTDIVGGSGISECADNPCSSLPCMNGGSCSVIAQDFHCACEHPWTGAMCEIDLTRAPCEPNPCEVDAECAVLPEGRFACRCPVGRDGDHCELAMAQEITVPEFRGNSFLEIKLKGTPSRSISFEVWFLSAKPNGVILYASQDGSEVGDFLSLNLVDGYLQFRFDLGSGFSNITSAERVGLNSWHRVHVSRINRYGTLVVDSQPPIRGHSPGDLKELNLEPVVYFGGFAGHYNPNSGCTVPFQGAIQRIYEDDEQVPELVAEAQSVYNLGQFNGFPCPMGDNPCLNHATCMPLLDDYECKCLPSYTGKKCGVFIHNQDTSHPIYFNTHTAHRYMDAVTEKIRSHEDNEFEIRFKTTTDRGLLLLLHKSATVQGDYLAIAVSRGHIEASYNLGKQTSESLHVIRSDVKVDDGVWHTVNFRRESRQGSLEIDGGRPIVEMSGAGATQLDTDGNLWLGGGHRIPVDLPDAYKQGFHGCIESVMVQGTPLNLVEDRTNHQHITTCDQRN